MWAGSRCSDSVYAQGFASFPAFLGHPQSQEGSLHMPWAHSLAAAPKDGELLFSSSFHKSPSVEFSWTSLDNRPRTEIMTVTRGMEYAEREGLYYMHILKGVEKKAFTPW